MGRTRKSQHINPLVALLAIPFLAFFMCCGSCGLLPRSTSPRPTASTSATIAPPTSPIVDRPVLNVEEPRAADHAAQANLPASPADDPFESQPIAGEQSTPEYRTWTSANGRFTTVAFLVQIKGDFVQLQKQDGQRVAVRLTKLSPADVAFATGSPSRVQVLDGKVVGITDGDTLTLLDGANQQHKIRLEGIDAPEQRQDYGTQARKSLSSKVFGKHVRIEWEDTDKYGRTLGHIHIGDRWINKELVAEGWAWHYKKYSSDPELAAAEVAARESKVGLWSDPNRAQAPWDFRAGSRPAPQPLVSAPVEEPTMTSRIEPRVEPAARYWLNTSSNVRHNSSCRHFANTKRGRYCVESEGRACGICGG